MVGVSRRPEYSGYGSVSSIGSQISIERWITSKDKFRVSADGQIPLLQRSKSLPDDVSSALPNDPSIVGPLKQVKSRIVEEVGTSMNDLRPSIAFHMRCRRNDFNAPRKPTVIIFCHPHSVCDFAAVEEKILNILNKLDISVFLGILPGKLVSTNPGSILRRMRIAPEELPEHPQRPYCDAHTDAHGIHWNDKRGRLAIEYPAALDAQIAMARLDELCRFYPDDQQLKRQQRQQRMLSELVAGPGIGKVLLASGHQVKDNHRLDWALIESPETFSSNRFPSAHQDSFALPTAGAPYRPHDAKITQFGIPKEDDWVVRIGRNTIASASISSMKKVEWLSGVFTQEIELLSEDDDVADERDSGSFVVDREGNLVGMILAVYRSPFRFHTAYMMTFDSIQSHIKNMTNGGFLSFG
ncbi:hypothetical protein A7D00_5964 [Trichophyton violaceum]|uniref:Uncharacterized protein n=1 Tax=Trichophyton violaceum TaxID=34388 RepID=A0A178FDC8_TRIVO|nr:hypothetical protein A7D00_5964 [Trichophyton violaceum]